jgi:hypothetical protein
LRRAEVSETLAWARQIRQMTHDRGSAAAKSSKGT